MKLKCRFSPVIRMCLPGMIQLSALSGAMAADFHWDGTSTSANADGGAGTWTADAGTANWSTAAAGGANVAWPSGSGAIFGGAAGTVSISGTVVATSLTFPTSGYELNGGTVSMSGTPGIDVAAGNVTIRSMLASDRASKTGPGTLILGGANTFMLGLDVTEGVVKLAHSDALGTGRGATMFPGTTLDLNGFYTFRSVSFSGAGVDGRGAVVNSHATSHTSFNGQMTGDATVGGTGDLTLTHASDFIMNGKTLTKKGANRFYLRSPVDTPGSFDIMEGELWLDMSSRLGAGDPAASRSITVRSGTLLGISERTSSFYGSMPVRMEPNTTWRATRTVNEWTAPVTLQGATTMDVPGTAAMTHFNTISGAGSVVKTGTGTWTLNKPATYTGGTTVNAGKVVLDTSPPTAGFTILHGRLTVNENTVVELMRANVFGTSPGNHVNPLLIHGGRVENLSTGVNGISEFRMTGGTLRSNGGARDASATNYFKLDPQGSITTLAADRESLISGRLDLGLRPHAAMNAPIHVERGTVETDLRVDAVVTETTPGTGIVKSGDGRMLLNAEASLTGATTVAAGTLLVGERGKLEQSHVTVMPGATFGSLTAGKTLAGITAQAGSRIILPAKAGSATHFSGALYLAGGNVTISPALAAGSGPGTYDLATISGPGVPVLDLSGAFGPTRATGSLVVNGNKLQLVLTGTGSSLVWNNASNGGAPAGTWNGTLANFSRGGVNDVFRAFDSVVFDDTTALGWNREIELAGTLAPSLLKADNSRYDYTFTGGTLRGAGSLVKSGSSSLTFSGPDAYGMTGEITVKGGTLDFSGKEISADRLTISGGAAFQNSTAAVGSVHFESGSSNANLSSPGVWSKTTPGTMVLKGMNQLTGAGILTAGELVVSDYDLSGTSVTLGTGPVHIFPGAALTFDRIAWSNPTSSAILRHSFSGSGMLKLLNRRADGAPSTVGFWLEGDNSMFSGPIHAENASISVRTGKDLGTGPVYFRGAGLLSVSGQIASNPLYFDSAEQASAIRGVILENTVLSGPIQLTGTASTSFGNSLSNQSSTISGPITETGGPARVSFSGGQPGMLTVSGASTYTGNTWMQGNVNLTGSLGATAVNVIGGALGGNGTMGPGASLRFSGGKLKVKTGAGALTVKGDVVISPPLRIELEVSPDYKSGDLIPILNYTGTLTGDPRFLSFDSSYRAEIANTPGQIAIRLGFKSLTWSGASGNVWQNAGENRWNTTGTGETDHFRREDSVLFNDSGTGSVRGSGSMWPAKVVFENQSKSYDVRADLIGTGPITKRGTGDVKLDIGIAHTGGIFVETGKLEGVTLGMGPITVSAGATLRGHFNTLGPVTVAGTIAPGGVNGRTISTGPLKIMGTYQCETTSTSSNALVVTGDLDITGAKLALQTTPSPGQPYIIASYTGSLRGRFSTVTGLQPNQTLFYPGGSETDRPGMELRGLDAG